MGGGGERESRYVTLLIPEGNSQMTAAIQKEEYARNSIQNNKNKT